MGHNKSPSFRRIRRLLTILALVLLAALGRPPQAMTQTGLSENQIKAGFLLNFMRFVQWPDSTYATHTAPINACIVGDNSMSELLTEAVAGKEVDSHPVHVRLTKASDNLHACNLVFIGAGEERHSAQVLENLKGASILTISAFSGFAKSGGMLNFYTQENKVKLEVNLDAATRANLKISAKLIAVAHLVSSKPAAGGA